MEVKSFATNLTACHIRICEIRQTFYSCHVLGLQTCEKSEQTNGIVVKYEKLTPTILSGPVASDMFDFDMSSGQGSQAYGDSDYLTPSFSSPTIEFESLG